MTFTEQFLKTDLTTPQEVLLNLLMKSIYEIRSEDLNVTIEHLEQFGDKEAIDAIKKSSVQEICLHTDNVKLVEDIPRHAQEIINNYNQLNAVTVFRGTRLPLSSSSFKNGYVHTTPQLATSAAYAVGISNSYGGIGRLLTCEGDLTGLGFIHAYDAPLAIKIYKNFQFEKFLNGTSEDSDKTLSDFKKELESFVTLDTKTFTIEYGTEKWLYGKPGNQVKMSNNMQKWYDFITSTKCMDTPYYEVMLPEQISSKYTFLINKNNDIVKLDLNNPKIKTVLNKLQGLLLRDFYEVLPLDKLVKEIDSNISQMVESKETNNEIENRLIHLVKNESLQLKELKQSVVDMIEKIKKNTLLSDQDMKNLMDQSIMVGSTNMIGDPTTDNKIKYHQLIEDFIKDIYKKKQKIELPLEEFSQSKNIVIDSRNNPDNPHSSFYLLDKLLNKINEKNIPDNLSLKEIDSDLMMLELMNNIGKKLKIINSNNPTIEDFVNNLKQLKQHDLLRQYCKKSLLTDIYEPLLQFIGNKTINQYVIPKISINKEILTTKNYSEKSREVICSNITSIRSKLIKKSEINTTHKIEN